ncbi:MAG: DUF2911 domain-containing protein [Bacteroidota bacterium]
MRRTLMLSCVLFSFLALTISTQAQLDMPAPSPFSEITQAVGLGEVTVAYSRPSMKGRTIFGELVPFGSAWRTGANASTKVTFSEDVMLEGKAVPAGTYSLYTIPGKTAWTVMLHKSMSLLMGDRYTEDEEQVRFTITPMNDFPLTVETFTIGFDNVKSNGAELAMYWENTRAAIGITTEVDSKVMAQIEETLAGPSQNFYFNAATYFYENGKDIAQAEAFIAKADPNEERFWMQTWKARIMEKAGKPEQAIAASKKALALAEKAGNGDYVKINKDLLTKWNALN